MKTVIILLGIVCSFYSIGQTTAIPDPNFEQALINLGIESGAPDGVILTSKIDTITSLNVGMKDIDDLTGIEDFVALEEFWCFLNNLTTIDVSNNTALKLFVPANNNLTSLDLTNNAAIEVLRCQDNNITSLDLSHLTGLHDLFAANNDLTCLNVKNGNNDDPEFFVFDVTGNPDLTCIEVDDAGWAAENWTTADENIDETASFSTNCVNECSSGTVEITEMEASGKELIKIVDLTGREVTPQRNCLLIYIYSDGATEKIYEIE